MKTIFEDTPTVQPVLFLFLLKSDAYRERQDSNGLPPLTQEKLGGLFGQRAWPWEEKEEMDTKREKKKVTGIRQMGDDSVGVCPGSGDSSVCSEQTSLAFLHNWLGSTNIQIKRYSRDPCTLTSAPQSFCTAIFLLPLHHRDVFLIF